MEIFLDKLPRKVYFLALLAVKRTLTNEPSRKLDSIANEYKVLLINFLRVPK
jgi:hypothetical protein